VRLDPATGRKVSEFRMPPPAGRREAPRWGYLNVAGDYLVGGADPLFDPNVAKESGPKPDRDRNHVDDDDPLSRLIVRTTRATNDNYSSSKHLVVMDRHTGRALWSVTAESGFRHNGICVGGGRLYCIDRLSGLQLGRLKRRGETPTTRPR